MAEDLRAKVFISCGQKKDTSEVRIAADIKRVLEDLGFDTYMATQDQNLRGLRENIFSHLSTSEYFLFIDFQRCQLVDSEYHRGSLFSHQELAIASYLEIEAIAFRDRSVLERDGMTGSLQLNGETFDDPNALPDMVRRTVEEKVKKGEWISGWKNALRLNRDSTEYVDASIAVSPASHKTPARFFHLRTDNLNPRKIGIGCTAFLETAMDLTNNRAIPLRTVDLDWVASAIPSTAIMPGGYRDLEAFHVIKGGPKTIRLGRFIDSTYTPQVIPGPGDFQLAYVVISESFPPARAITRVHVGQTLDDIQFWQETP